MNKIPRGNGIEEFHVSQRARNIPAALEDSDYVQRFRVAAVQNEIRIDWVELHPFVRQILAPVSDARFLGQRHNLAANRRFNTICAAARSFTAGSIRVSQLLHFQSHLNLDSSSLRS
jgi:hypothetical protein